MKSYMRSVAAAILVLLGAGGGALAATGPASAHTLTARPQAAQQTFSGNYEISYQFFVNGNGSGVTMAPLSFSTNGTFAIGSYSGGYVYTVKTSTLSFQINSGCVPVYTGVGSATAGFIGTLKCTLKGNTSETGNWTAVPVTSAQGARHSGSAPADGHRR